MLLQALKKRIIRGHRMFRTLWFKIFNIVLVFVVAKAYVSQIDPSGYGQYMIIHGYLLTISTVFGSGNGLYVFHQLTGAGNARRATVFEGFTIVAITSFMLWVVGYIVLTHFLNTDLNLFYLSVSFASYSLAAFSCEVSRLWVRGDGYMMLKDTVRALTILVVILVFPTRESEILVAAGGIVSMIVAGAYLLMKVRLYEWDKTHVGFLPSNLVNQLKHGTSIGISKGLQIFRGWIEIFLGGVLFSEYWVGMYSLFLRLAKLVNLPIVALDADIARPLAAFTKGESLSKMVEKQVKYSKWLSTVFGLGAILITVPFIQFYANDVTSVAVVTCVILILSNMFNSYFGPIGVVSQLGRLKKEYIFSALVSILVLAVSSYLLVPIFGVVSLALMSLVSKQFWNWYIYQAVYNHYGYKF